MESLNHLLLLCSILFLSLGAQTDARVPQFSPMLDRYRLWMAEHGKIYPKAAEREKRFEIFQDNVKYIDAFNAAGNKTYTLGLNQFTDLTNEERIARFTGYQPPPRVWNASANYQPETVGLDELPTSWDWREEGAVTPVKDQTCGNCWLFAGVAEVESVNYIATKQLSILSEQEIMDCDDLPGKGGCNGGWPQEVYEYVKHYSLTTEADYPNKPEAQTCDISKKKKDPRSAHVSDFINMPAFLSDEELMAAVVKQPVGIGIDVSSPDFGAYKSGVFTGQCDFNLNHAMSIVGFGEEDGLKYWIVRNSWSDGWGDGGYIKIQRDTGRKEGLCGVNLTPSYPVY